MVKLDNGCSTDNTHWLQGLVPVTFMNHYSNVLRVATFPLSTQPLDGLERSWGEEGKRRRGREERLEWSIRETKPL